MIKNGAQTYRTLDEALTAAAGPGGVIRSSDIDGARLLAHSLDDAHTTELREKVTTVSDYCSEPRTPPPATTPPANSPCCFGESAPIPLPRGTP